MIPQSAVIIWQLRGFVEDVHCFFLKRLNQFTLVIERAGERLLQEEHQELPALMLRASELRRSLVQVGFTPFDRAETEPQPVLESLLRRFVMEGTTSLHLGPAA